MYALFIYTPSFCISNIIYYCLRKYKYKCGHTINKMNPIEYKNYK